MTETAPSPTIGPSAVRDREPVHDVLVGVDLLVAVLAHMLKIVLEEEGRARATRREVRPEDLASMLCAEYIRDSTPDRAEGLGPEIQWLANRDAVALRADRYPVA